MPKKQKNEELNDHEEATAILENVFGASLEISSKPDPVIEAKKAKRAKQKQAASQKEELPAKPQEQVVVAEPQVNAEPKVNAEPQEQAVEALPQVEAVPPVAPIEASDSERPMEEIEPAKPVEPVTACAPEQTIVHAEDKQNEQPGPVEVSTPTLAPAPAPVAEEKANVIAEAKSKRKAKTKPTAKVKAAAAASSDEDPTTETQPVEKKTAEGPSFADLPLSDEVKTAVKNAGYEQPTPIQAEIIPYLLHGRDVLAQSQTGTGKTAAFALPILTRIETECKEPQVLVLVPTRELAIQVGKSFATYGAQLPGFNLAIIYGGQDYEIQYRQLRKGPQIIVGTPGRVIDHIKNKKLDVSEIECLVLDEADEMLNMGFLEDVKFVLDHAPDERQIALFSATLPDAIRKISQRYLNNPAKVTIKQKTLTADSIRQRAVFVAPRDRVDMLVRFLEAEEADGAIVFTRTRESTTVVADKLVRAGLRAFALNGEMPQKSRERTIQKLKSGEVDILVATDIAARGLDVSRVSHVFNYDLPEGPEAYTHRIGRTGRAGKKGEAIIFATQAQRGKLRFIEKITRKEIEIVDPPTADQINKMRVKKFHASIDKTIAERDMQFFEKLINEYVEESEHPVEKIAAAIAMLGQNGRDFFMKDRPIRERKDKRKDGRKSNDGRYSGGPEPGMTRFRLAVGKQDGVRPGNIVGAVTNEASLDGDDIGSIRIHHSYSTVDLPEDRADEIVDLLSETRVSGRAIKIRVYEDRGGHSGRENGKKPYGNRRNKPSRFSKSKHSSGGSRSSGRGRSDEGRSSGSNSGSSKRYGKQSARPKASASRFKKKRGDSKAK